MARARTVALERTSWVPAVALSSSLAAALLAWNPHVRDLAAHAFRTELFERDGFSLWNASWYGGHYVLTHSVLFPPLAALLGARLVGAIAVVASTYLFDRIVRERWGEQARLATLWFGAGAVTMLASGRLTFALGVAFGLACLRALQRGRRVPASVLALGCALASPVAAVFLAGVLAVGCFATPRRRLTPLLVAVAALVPVLALNVLFSEGGREPFSFSAWIALPLWSAGALWVTRGMEGERELRAVVLAYLVAGTLIWIVPNPLGGNATRLGALFGGPVLAAALLSRGVRLAAPAVALVLAGSVWWQVQPAVRDVAQSVGDASTSSAYYEPLAGWLRDHGGRDARIEVPFTSGHWETAHLAPEFELARGWLRQLDRSRNGLFYEGKLTHARYQAWLEQNGIRYVALADVPLDYSARDERKLIQSEPAYLRPLARLEHWRIYGVPGRKPLLEGIGGARASLVRLEPASFTLRVRRPGRFIVRIRATPYWKLRANTPGCVGKSGRWALVNAERRGLVDVSIRFSLRRAGRSATGSNPRC